MIRHFRFQAVLSLLLCLFLRFSAQSATRSVLFIGNSFTYTNNMPQMLQQMAAANGDTLIFDQNTPGGYSFENHSTDATTIGKIFSRQWDVVVLQEQSQRPAFSQPEVATICYPYAHMLDSMVQQNDSCTQTMFLMTWGYKNGDASNCSYYAPVCTYDGMQAGLRSSYMQMAVNNAGIVAPVGVAWKRVRDSIPAIDLYSSDDMHPGLPGSYLEACVLYASIFHHSPIGNPYMAGVNSADALKLQLVASHTTFDSLSMWIAHGHYPYAAFSKSYNGQTVNFQNQSLNAGNYLWDFGDGNTSALASPAHTYTTPGNYTVTLSAGNCFHSVRTDTVSIHSTDVLSVNPERVAVTASISGNGRFGLSWNISVYNQLIIYSEDGRKVKSYNLEAGRTSVADYMQPGFYIYHFTGNDHRTFTGKIIVQ